ncbi:hypothetical protein HPP92_015737 [Vanilla planifolia]|uniref:Transmembrane protein 245 n=1 Tax=Vanilla planifolia TaxID=51239 RepID=A0A835QP81_VANPL|nr:hypothetical protein HPP92_015737 [Vanilla planifolia]
MEFVPSSSSKSKSNLESNPNKFGCLPWSEMFRSASQWPPLESLPSRELSTLPRSASFSAFIQSSEVASATAGREVRLALYIAMAHAGLAFTLILLYGLYRLLQDFLRPLLWALLCSIPLREIQDALVSFWSNPLRHGLVPTVLAIPAASFRASADTIADFRSILLRRPLIPSPSGRRFGFYRLLRWLATFWLFLISFEYLGASALLLLTVGAFLAGPTASVVHHASFANGHHLKTGSSVLTVGILRNLKTIVALCLIAVMILGLVFSLVFFSYKIGIEGKDAVLSIKSHVQDNNYAEKIGLKKWLDENDIPNLLDKYSAKLYDSIWEQLDQLGIQYNLTEFVNGLRHCIISEPVDSSQDPSTVLSHSLPHPHAVKLQTLSILVKNHQWADAYAELYSFVQELMVARVDLAEKAKGLVFQGMEVAKQVMGSSISVLGGSASLLISIALKIISGAAEVLNFISQLMVFLWVLYYLITSESGGGTEQVMGMLPISKTTRDRCIEVINHAISSVLLATVKIAIFQGFLTWLLFRPFSVHFAYMSAALAFVSAMLPLLPNWMSTIPALLQLLMEGKYVWAIGLAMVHLLLLDYGVSVIQEDIPGHNAYLTGLSILGGMTLFPNSLEGAILGPLMMAIFIATKNLYSEFVLNTSESKT